MVVDYRNGWDYNIVPPTDEDPVAAVFQAHARQAIEAGWSPIPGRYQPARNRPLKDAKRPLLPGWEKFCDRVMTHVEINDILRNHPLAQLHVASGYAGVIWIDRDTDDPEINAVIDRIIGKSNVARRGSKGRADAYRVVGAGVRNEKFLSRGVDGKPGAPIMEVLAAGSSVRIPPSLHPESGKPYVWLTQATVFDTLPDELTQITAEQIEQLRVALKPWLFEKPTARPVPRIKVDPTTVGYSQRKHYQAMAESQLRRHFDDAASQRKPGRNRAIFAAVCAVGVFVHAGLLSQDRVEAAAREAARINGILCDNGAHDLAETIANGLRKSEADALPLLEDRPLPATRTRAKQVPAKVVYGGASRLDESDVLIWPELTQGGEPRIRSQPNIEAFLEYSGITLAFNAFSSRNVIRRGGAERALEDADLRALWLQADRLGLQSNQKYFSEVILNICFQHQFNPVLDYLNGLNWDGKPRLDTWLTRYVGAADTKLTRAFGVCHLIASVRRVRHPGKKHDAVLVLEGPEGAGKSTVPRILAGDDHFVDDLELGSNSKIIMEKTDDVWIVEFDEMNGMTKREFSAVKAMLSHSSDKDRLAYDRFSTRRKRKFVCFGSVNGRQWLPPEDGRRRFWPVQVGIIDHQKLIDDRDQLWAEAAHREAQGESHILPESLWAEARAEQANRVVADPWQEMLEDCLGDKWGQVETRAVWECVGVKGENRNPVHGRRIARIMEELGYTKKRRRKGGGKPLNCYVREKAEGEGEGQWMNF
jgi:hypothetical protein